MTDNNQPRVGVSACLMGQPVRFDAGHRKNRFLVEDCAGFFQLHPVCPEAELGLGIPRPALQLRQYDQQVRLVYSKNPAHELTPDMRAFAEQRIDVFEQLDGFVFKKDSPSCGLERVPVYDNVSGMRERKGTGVFAETFRRRHPMVPVEDEGRLQDRDIRQNFLERVYAHYRWRQMVDADSKPAGLRDYHQRYKLMLMAKSPDGCRRLGQLVAGAGKQNLPGLRQQYLQGFMQVMEKRPTSGQQVNVLMHIMGYLKSRLDSRDKAELLDWFESYRRQQVSRVTPLVLLQHHLRRYPNDYMAAQYYFSPFPSDLMQPV
jgi:uncharacterized protein YbgA (DUF1722 family)/uncharacterized protein YbbK (DUF523 family)